MQKKRNLSTVFLKSVNKGAKGGKVKSSSENLLKTKLSPYTAGKLSTEKRGYPQPLEKTL